MTTGIINSSENQEKQYLEEIKEKIKRAVTQSGQSARQKAAELLEQKQYVRDNRDEKEGMIQYISLTAGSGEALLARNRRLAKLLQSPYFGRIDFREHQHHAATPVYIGVHAFTDQHTGANLIYDWRAPISSMFYDTEPGDARYEAPSGPVSGQLELKRQYRIRNGQLEFMLNTAAHIYDDLLQKELSTASADRMKNIVATIQQDQHQVIRNENANVLIIQGVAGSGKTSIALHRIAFLLYRFKDTIKAGDVLILSPNKVFSDYISNVLPELGEENVPTSGMYNLLQEITGYKHQAQHLFGQVSAQLRKTDTALEERIRFKSSSEFLVRLNEYVIYLNNHCYKPVEIRIGRYVLPASFVREKAEAVHRQPILKRPQEIVNALTAFITYKYGHTVTAKEKDGIRKAVTGMFISTNMLKLYKDFFMWMNRPDLFKMAAKDILEHHDLSGLAYLKICLQGVQPQRKTKHLLIDEMQDYTPVQYAVIARMFSCRMTLLGDVNQSLNPAGKTGPDDLKRIFPRAQLVTLNRSYRSTYEIIRFTQAIAFNDALIAVERHGETPHIFITGNEKEEVITICGLINTFLQEARYNSLAVICKTEEEAGQLATQLDRHGLPAQLLLSGSTSFREGLLITSAHLAKGLEFDQVIVPFVNNTNYKREIDRNMLYIACTRAMHHLSVTCSGTPSSFISKH
ncbi:MAG TPA: 3'-5' exonuclease [Chitinophaga sp.]|uniref:HelD family protein n=1 Tax=Chitinophaga sp. TaxID=1869181 RepID=UPI002D1457DB|nr:3'-5' exonuclease [Chitinophaga sp.]HVI43421.1 3'-5' exonuclease [Chitinophaga sp.]